MKLFEAKAALEECVTLQDFNKASVLKEQITELEHTKTNLIKEAEQCEINEMRVEKVSTFPFSVFSNANCSEVYCNSF